MVEERSGGENKFRFAAVKDEMNADALGETQHKKAMVRCVKMRTVVKE